MPSERAAIQRWLNDIRHNVEMAESFIVGLDFDAFRDDMRTVYAVIRCLEIISEASRRLPDELKGRHPEIAWREMAASGNIYRHEYEDVSARRVWQTLTVSIPPLRDVVVRELAILEE